MMKKRYADKLLSGEKTVTIRLGIVKPKYRELIVHAGGRPVAKVYVDKVTYKRVYELTLNEALKEGFCSVEELLNELRKVYGNLPADAWVTVMELKLLQRLDSTVLADPYLGFKPTDIARIALRYIKDELSDDEVKILVELTKNPSIRAVALKLYGDYGGRKHIRRILKKALKIMIEKKIIGGSN